MPQSPSAIKRLRQNKPRQERNQAIRSRLRTGRRRFLDYIKQENKEEAGIALKKVYGLLDRAEAKGIIKKNYGSRQKSHLAAKLNSLAQRSSPDNLKNHKSPESSQISN